VACLGKETIHPDFTNVSNYIHPITLEAAAQVASNLRPDDRREVEEGHGIPSALLPSLMSQNPSYVYFTVPDGKTAGMAGVGQEGDIWMLCTPDIHRYPITFAREAKRYVDSRIEPLLWNIVDSRNTAHLKLLKFLGFKFLRKLKHGPNNITFIEFCRVRRC
jgi:hypothetical protein